MCDATPAWWNAAWRACRQAGPPLRKFVGRRTTARPEKTEAGERGERGGTVEDGEAVSQGPGRRARARARRRRKESRDLGPRQRDDGIILPIKSPIESRLAVSETTYIRYNPSSILHRWMPSSIH
jgi:hypothetical protein